ncbi:MAG: hypothetical protein ACOYEP_05110 [Limnochordia bacterium]
MHDHLTEKLLLLERLLLRHDYSELLFQTRADQLREKVLRIIRLKEEQVKLLDDLLKETAQFNLRGLPIREDAPSMDTMPYRKRQHPEQPGLDDQ